MLPPPRLKVRDRHRYVQVFCASLEYLAGERTAGGTEWQRRLFAQGLGFCLYSPRCCETEGAPAFVSLHINPWRLWSRIWRMCSHLCVLLFLCLRVVSMNRGAGRLAISSHLRSVCYGCLVGDPPRSPSSPGAPQVSSLTPGQVGAFLHYFFKECLLIPEVWSRQRWIKYTDPLLQ